MLRKRGSKFKVRNAVEEVRNEVLSSLLVWVNVKNLCIKIAKKKKLNPMAVLRCYHRRYKDQKQPLVTRKFTYLFERYVAVFIASCSEAGQHFSLKDLLTIFAGATPKGEKKPTYRYLHGWLRRHADLVKVSDTEVIEADRFTPDLRSRCLKFVDILRAYQSKIYFHEDIVVNADETRIVINSRKPSTKSVTSIRHVKAEIPKMKRFESRAMLTFCNATGDVLLNVVVTPTTETKKLEKWQKIPAEKEGVKKRRILNKAYAWTVKGWVTKSVWEQSVKLFVTIMRRQFPGRQVILIIDQLAAHMNWGIVNYLYQRGVYCFFLPKKSSHILQPLDQYIFANFKNLLRARVFDYLQKHGWNAKVPLNEIIQEVEEEAITRNLVRKSFEVVGLSPFCGSTMTARINEKLQKTREVLITPPGDDVTSKLQQQVISLLVSNTMKNQKTKPQQLQARVKTGEVYTTEDLQARHQRRKEEKEKKEREAKLAREEKKKRREMKKHEQQRRQEQVKKKKRENYTKKLLIFRQQQQQRRKMECRMCRSVHRGGIGWYVCSICDSFRLCPVCENQFKIFNVHCNKCNK